MKKYKYTQSILVCLLLICLATDLLIQFTDEIVFLIVQLFLVLLLCVFTCYSIYMNWKQTLNIRMSCKENKENIYFALFVLFLLIMRLLRYCL